MLLEDSDGSHGIQSFDNPVRRYKDSLQGFQRYADPPQSLYFNIIENVWRIFKQRVKRHCYKAVNELKAAIELEWSRMEQWKINEIVDSMPTRLRQC